MKPQTPIADHDDSIEPPAPTEGTFRFFVLVEAPDEAIRTSVLRRFALEFGLDEQTRNCSASRSNLSMALLGGQLDGERLPAFQQHADRVARLFSPHPLKIQFGHGSQDKITLAVSKDAPGRIYLRGGIWAAILGERDADGNWSWSREQPAVAAVDVLEHFFIPALDKS